MAIRFGAGNLSKSERQINGEDIGATQLVLKTRVRKIKIYDGITAR